MPPKKTEAALLADVAEHRRWAVANLTALRARSGFGLQARLQQRAGPEEKRMHNWYVKHAGVASADHPTVAAALSELDALVNDSPGPAASACPNDAPPAKQRRLTERGGEAAACAAPTKGESGPRQSTPARGVAPTACSTRIGPAAAATRAPPASSLPTSFAETPAKRPRLVADGLGATPAQAGGHPSEREQTGLAPDATEPLARSRRKSPRETPLQGDSAGGASGYVERPGPRPQDEERLLAATSRRAARDLHERVRDEALR